jgi:hypothetical protein
MVLAVALVLAVLFPPLMPAGASAQSCAAPPGTAATDQYCEPVPNVTGGVGGEVRSGGGGPTTEGTLADVLPEALVKQLLADKDPDALALLDLPAGTVGRTPDGMSFAPDAGALGESALTPKAGEGGGGVVASVVRAAGAGASSGLLWVMATMLVAAGGGILAFGRLRRG